MAGFFKDWRNFLQKLGSNVFQTFSGTLLNKAISFSVVNQKMWHFLQHPEKRNEAGEGSRGEVLWGVTERTEERSFRRAVIVFYCYLKSGYCEEDDCLFSQAARDRMSKNAPTLHQRNFRLDIRKKSYSPKGLVNAWRGCPEKWSSHHPGSI